MEQVLISDLVTTRRSERMPRCPSHKSTSPWFLESGRIQVPEKKEKQFLDQQFPIS